MEFILQKRMEPFYPTLEKWIEDGNHAAIQSALQSLLDLLTLRCQKGIYDKDPDLRTNFGFLNGKAVQMDIGRFRYEKKMIFSEIYLEEISRIIDPMQRWLQKKNSSNLQTQPIE